jgi:hypothetical protein
MLTGATGCGRTRPGTNAAHDSEKFGNITMFWFTYPLQAAWQAQRIMMFSFLGPPAGQQRREESISSAEQARSAETPTPAGEQRETVVSDDFVEMTKTAGSLPVASRPVASRPAASRLKTASPRKATVVKKCRKKGAARKKIR